MMKQSDPCSINLILSNPIDLCRLCSISWPLFVRKSLCVTIQYQPGRENFHMPQYYPAHPQPGGMDAMSSCKLWQIWKHVDVMKQNIHDLNIHWPFLNNGADKSLFSSWLILVSEGLKQVKLVGEVLLVKLVNSPLGTAAYQYPTLGTNCRFSSFALHETSGCTVYIHKAIFWECEL